MLGLARRGGALFANPVTGDVIGIDQRGTGQSVPGLASSALYALPLDQAGALERFLSGEPLAADRIALPPLVFK